MIKFLGIFLVLGAIQIFPSVAIESRSGPTPTTTSTKSTTTTSPLDNRPRCLRGCGVPIFLPDTNCSKYWRCVYGTSLLLTCPSGQNWNPDKDICDCPANAGCDGQGWRNVTITCPTTPEPTTTPKPTSPPNSPPCPVDCPYPLFAPDKDCCSYWQCNCGVATKLSCPPNLEWNPILDTCDWPANAGCTGQGWCDDDLECKPLNTTTTKLPTTTKNPRAPPCPDNCYSLVLIPSTDCCKYWQCDNGKATEVSCPNGLQWNPNLRTCDWPSNAGCTGQGWCDDDLKCPPTTQPTTPTTTTKNPRAPPCPADCCEPLLVPSTDCCKYWECDGGVATEITCPGGLQFNPNLEVCDCPETAGCTGQGWCEEDLIC